MIGILASGVDDCYNCHAVYGIDERDKFELVIPLSLG